MSELKIPNQDRIRNRFAVTSPDKTILNADNVMALFDNLINGIYRLKPAKTYKTYADLQAETILELGQSAYVEEYPNNLYIYNGNEWVSFVGGSGAFDHTKLTNRDANDQHPISAITNLQENLDNKQDKLVSGTNIKTINNQSILGSGNIDIQGGSDANIEEYEFTNSVGYILETGINLPEKLFVFRNGIKQSTLGQNYHYTPEDTRIIFTTPLENDDIISIWLLEHREDNLIDGGYASSEYARYLNAGVADTIEFDYIVDCGNSNI